jgi:hypothetical protein
MTGAGLVNGITDQTIQFVGKMQRVSGIRYPQWQQARESRLQER